MPGRLVGRAEERGPCPCPALAWSPTPHTLFALFAGGPSFLPDLADAGPAALSCRAGTASAQSPPSHSQRSHLRNLLLLNPIHFVIQRGHLVLVFGD